MSDFRSPNELIFEASRTSSVLSARVPLLPDTRYPVLNPLLLLWTEKSWRREVNLSLIELARLMPVIARRVTPGLEAGIVREQCSNSDLLSTAE